MKASDGDGAGPGPSKAPGSARWLLIGNSRWHFAHPGPERLHCWSVPPPRQGDDRAEPERPQRWPQLLGWAAVGPLPPNAGLERRSRITLSRVPLQQLPPWLGIDRALVGWQAWRSSHAPVLVVDAGTALSFTLVDGRGCFVGGRIQAGLALQLRALASGTDQLPALPTAAREQPRDAASAPPTPWPRATAAAMDLGVREGLVAAVGQAWQQARASQADCRLWITGGDGAWIAARLGSAYAPCLALQALAGLSTPSELS